jgi:hypothetical protein
VRPDRGVERLGRGNLPLEGELADRLRGVAEDHRERRDLAIVAQALEDHRHGDVGGDRALCDGDRPTPCADPAARSTA